MQRDCHSRVDVSSKHELYPVDIPIEDSSANNPKARVDPAPERSFQPLCEFLQIPRRWSLELPLVPWARLGAYVLEKLNYKAYNIINSYRSQGVFLQSHFVI